MSAKKANTGRRVLITGATSAIARAVAERVAARGDHVALAGRDLPEIERLAADLRVAYGVDAHALRFDAEQEHSGSVVVDEATGVLGGLDGVFVVHGVMWDQDAVDAEPGLARRMAVVNLASVSEIAHGAAGVMTRDHGADVPGERRFICLVSSVAGDRGRPSNVAYGASKAGVNALGEGLRGRLRAHGIRVVVVKPGFVDTAMTWGQDGMFLVADPETVGRRIELASRRGGRVVYVPWFWRWIMAVIRLIPRAVFDRMGL